MITPDNLKSIAINAALYRATLTLNTDGLLIEIPHHDKPLTTKFVLGYLELATARYPVELVRITLQKMHKDLYS